MTLPPGQSSPIRLAVPRTDDPSAWLEAHYRRLATERAPDSAVVNPALQVAAIGFRRIAGDWLGVMVTPWFLNLFLLSGGGTLWGDIPAGQRRYLNLPCGTLQFVAEDDPEIGPTQFCPLIAPATAIADMATARQVAADALAAVFGEAGATSAGEPPASIERKDVSRRGFLRALAGRR